MRRTKLGGNVYVASPVAILNRDAKAMPLYGAVRFCTVGTKGGCNGERVSTIALQTVYATPPDVLTCGRHGGDRVPWCAGRESGVGLGPPSAQNWLLGTGDLWYIKMKTC